jgi:molybdopterin-synthase adenylyltransferase
MITKPKIKDGVTVMYRKIRAGYEVSFYFPASSKCHSFLLNKRGFECLGYMRGGSSIEDIARKCRIDIQSLNHLIGLLDKINVLESSPVIVGKELTRFSRQLNFFADFEKEGISRVDMQRKLQDSSVGVVGLGGVGSWVAQGLALAGVKNLTIVDPDRVELSNLSRQCLYANTDIGSTKVSAIQKSLTSLDDKIVCTCFQTAIDSVKKCSRIFRGVDLVINCADHPDVDVMNRLVSRSCFASNTPHILCGGYDGHLSFIGPTVIPGKTPCWFCYEHGIDKKKKASGLQHLPISEVQIQGGSIGAISAITANIHVLEAVRLLSGWSDPKMVGQTGEFDFLGLTLSHSSFSKIKTCKQCGRSPKK